MKKIILTILFIMVAQISFAESKSYIINNNWTVISYKDDFTDVKVCGVTNTKRKETERTADITIFVNHQLSGKHAMMYIGNIKGIGLKYRIDQDEPVQIGYEYEFETDKDIYFIEGSEYDRMINDFKTGLTVTYQVTSGNQFVKNKTNKVSLKGFTEAYEMAEACDF